MALPLFKKNSCRDSAMAAGETKRDQPWGELVPVVGRAVHCRFFGAERSGQTSVWLENGWFGQLLGWQPFPEQLAARGFRVCAYDRAGYGWSEEAGADRSAVVAAVEFAQLLDTLSERTPILLIAWSGGGLVANCFAAAWPERVAGLILLDAIPPTYDAWAEERSPERWAKERAATIQRLRRIAARAADGVLLEEEISEYLAPTTRARFGERYLTRMLCSGAHWRTYAAEMAAARRSGEQASARAWPRSLPVTALISGRPALEEIEDPEEREWMAAWRAQQRELVARSDQGRAQVIDAGHAIHREAPAAILNAVDEWRSSLATQMNC